MSTMEDDINLIRAIQAEMQHPVELLGIASYEFNTSISKLRIPLARTHAIKMIAERARPARIAMKEAAEHIGEVRNYIDEVVERIIHRAGGN